MMGILIFILTGIASLILISAIRKEDSAFTSNIVVSIVIGIFFAGIGTYRGCADGWASTSIGKQGACSHHGGVETFLNIYGTSSLAISALIIILMFLRHSNK